jgi:hypothetical protein
MGVTVDRIDQPFELPETGVGSPDEIVPPAGEIRGRGSVAFFISPVSNLSAKVTNRLLARGAKVAWAMDEFTADRSQWPAGTIVVSGLERSAVEDELIGRGISAHAVRDTPRVATSALHAPKVGLYRSWQANMPEGWTRWLLERYEFDFENLTDEDIRSRNLAAYDVIILPDQDGQEILHGHLEGTMPAAYTGGVGLEGALALKQYVANGGWLVAIDHAVDFAIDAFGLPVRNVVRGTRSDEFFVPGSLINFELDPKDPLAFGMPDAAVAFFVNSQVLELIEAAEEGDNKIERDVVSYATFPKDNLLASGWILGGDRYLAEQTAAMRIPRGQGQVVLLAFEPHFRAQSHNTFKMLFNPLHASTLPPEIWPEVLQKAHDRKRTETAEAP